MSRFRKKPVVIDAIQVSDVRSLGRDDWPDWLREAHARRDFLVTPSTILIGTREGDMRAQNDDWIIRGVAGELYPCKPDIFDATYEPA